MNRLTGGGVLLALGLLSLATPQADLHAQANFSGCAQGNTSSFKVCTSAESWYSAGTLFFNVKNLNQSSQSNPLMADYASATGGWHTIAAIGLENLHQGIDYTVGASGLSLVLKYFDGSAWTTFAANDTEWAVGANALQITNTGSSTDGHKQGITGGYDPGPNSAGHLRTVGNAYVQFAISGFTAFNYNSSTAFEWHSRQVANEDCTGAVGAECMTANSLKGSVPPTNVVPEPMSMALLGTGLAGVAAVRRRRKEDSAA